MREVIYLALGSIVTAALVYAAWQERGYWAVGSEWIWWTLPVMVAAARTERKKENENYY